MHLRRNKMYEPREDSYLIKKHIKDYAKGSVLDMGTGSGILAIEAAKFADSVVACDIDADLIKDLKVKFEKNKKIQFDHSNLFDSFKTNARLQNKKFDLIVFNPPYLPEDKGIKDKEIYGGKKGYEIIANFLKNAKKYLKKDGRILLLFSSLTNKKQVDGLIEKNKLKFKLIDKKRIFFEELYVYLIY